MADYSISEMLKVIEADTIYIPKSVARRDDIYDASKALFGVIFTDCVDNLRAYGSSIDGETIGKMMKAYVMDMTIPDIQCECLCSPSMALRLQEVKLSCSSIRLTFRNACGKDR